MTDTTTTAPAAPAEGDTGPIPSEAAGAWHREYPDGWEFLLPGGVLRVPYEAVDADRPLHEQLQRFADGLHLLPELGRPANVIEALAACIRDMPAVGKDQQMSAREGGGQTYAYRSIEAVTSHASALFGRYCVVVKPHKIKRTVREITLGNKPWTEDCLRVKYRIYGPGGRKDFIDTAWFHALARDNSDKGTNKAMTQAFKQCLLQVLVVGDNKDDPDTYSPQSDGSQPRQPTIEEWSLANGWDSNQQRLDAARHARACIKAEVDAGRLDPGGAQGLWEDYKQPDGEHEQPRTWTEHATWMAEHLADAYPVLPAEETQPAEPPTADGLQEPPEAGTAQPEPEPATETEASQETAQPAESEQPAFAYDEADGAPFAEPHEPEGSGESWAEAADPEPPAQPEPPEDNGYRGGLDSILREQGVDGLMGHLRAQPLTAVVEELRIRGVQVVGRHSADSLRRDVAAIVVRNASNPQPEPPAAEQAEEPSAPSRRRRS